MNVYHAIVFELELQNGTREFLQFKGNPTLSDVYDSIAEECPKHRILGYILLAEPTKKALNESIQNWINSRK